MEKYIANMAGKMKAITMTPITPVQLQSVLKVVSMALAKVQTPVLVTLAGLDILANILTLVVVFHTSPQSSGRLLNPL